MLGFQAKFCFNYWIFGSLGTFPVSSSTNRVDSFPVLDVTITSIRTSWLSVRRLVGNLLHSDGLSLALKDGG